MTQFIDEALGDWLKKWPPPTVRPHLLPSLVEEPDAIVRVAAVLFFASLATEEKEPTQVAVAWHARGTLGLKGEREHDLPLSSIWKKDPNGLAWEVLPFGRRVLDVANLAKTSPVTEFGKSMLVVGQERGQFYIEGVARLRPRSRGGRSWVLKAEAPGVVTIEIGGIEVFRYERGAVVPSPPDIFNSTVVAGALSEASRELMGPDSGRTSMFGPSPIEIIRSLTESMNRTQHGGLLLFLPSEITDDDLERVKLHVDDEEVLLRAISKVHRLASSVEDDLAHGRNSGEGGDVELDAARQELDAWVDVVGRFSAVDNAVLIGPCFRVYGAQYEVVSESAPLIYEASDVYGAAGAVYRRHHGSRHRAAASFVEKEEGRIAILSSADGPLRCFMKVEGKVVMWPFRL
ncbi:MULTISPECIES: putative sensor domain DACNV-containing protein [Corallococcus]|uniref:putative sensor domain DACNV-containing protein n=1 Tax=Corallococcus TaxID=83461 RepID=UPI0011C46E5E|nr:MULTISPECIES: hypothetical protein [Corallococcus]